MLRPAVFLGLVAVSETFAPSIGHGSIAKSVRSPTAALNNVMWASKSLQGKHVRHSSLVSLRAASYPTDKPLENEATKAQIICIPTAAADYTGGHLVVSVVEPEGEDKEALAQLGVSAAVDSKLDGAVLDLITATEFKGKAGTGSTVRLGKGSAVPMLSICGAGKAGKMDAATADKMGKHIATVAKADKKAKSIAVLMPEGTDAAMIGRLTESLLSSLYEDGRYKTGEGKPKPLALEKVEILGCSDSKAAQAIKDGSSLTRGITLCKDLVNAPPNYCTPSMLADMAVKIAKETGMKCQILEKDDCEKLGMGSYLGVAKGSSEPPKFIHLTYTPSGDVKKKVAVVGKGLTFDSGGYNLKAGPGSMIEMMKFDMGGSGATLGAALSTGLLKPEGVEAHFIVASCENMVNGEAMRPGDILTASNGKTIEVINTDAEGRLTLADALVYAEKQGAEEIVDIATLTGACIQSLGMQYAGLWSNNETMAEDLKNSSATAGEKLWHMPLCEESYGEQVKGKIADLANLGGKGAGSITAALFLKQFVNKSHWAHIDIAGPVWDDKSGATGYGVRTLTQWIIGRGK